MQAGKLLKVGRFEVLEVPDPVAGLGEVIIRVAAAGVCGTDRHLLLGEFTGRPPVILGHEFSGTVEAVGDGVTSHAFGDRVACDPNIACGACPPCRMGRINLCENLVAIGVHRDGGFAELCAFPAHRALKLPNGLSLRDAALSEPLACCLHALDIGAPKPGERVTILGGGVIGLLCLQLARLAGADVLMVTRSPQRRRIAEEFGALSVATPEEAASVFARGADLVLECAGVGDTVRQAPSLAARGGRVVIVGVLARGETVPIEPFDLLVREVDLRMAFVNPFTQGRAIELLASGAVKVAPLVTTEVGRTELPAILSSSPGPAEVKVLVTA